MSQDHAKVDRSKLVASGVLNLFRQRNTRTKGGVRARWKDDAPVVVKTAFLEHTLLMTESRAEHFVSNANNHALHGICLPIKRHGRVKSKVIKKILNEFFHQQRMFLKTMCFRQGLDA